jgi:hypothetical protein
MVLLRRKLFETREVTCGLFGTQDTKVCRRHPRSKVEVKGGVIENKGEWLWEK